MKAIKCEVFLPAILENHEVGCDSLIGARDLYSCCGLVGSDRDFKISRSLPKSVRTEISEDTLTITRAGGFVVGGGVKTGPPASMSLVAES